MAGSSAVLPFIVQYDGCPRPAHRASHRHNNDQKRHSWPQTHKNQKQDKHMNRKHWHPDTSHGWGPHNNYRGERHRQQHQTPRSQVPLDGLHTVGSRQANSDRLVGGEWRLRWPESFIEFSLAQDCNRIITGACGHSLLNTWLFVLRVLQGMGEVAMLCTFWFPQSLTKY